MKPQGLFFSSLAITESHKLFGITEDKLDLKPGFIELVDFLGLQTQIGGEDEGIAYFVSPPVV